MNLVALPIQKFNSHQPLLLPHHRVYRLFRHDPIRVRSYEGSVRTEEDGFDGEERITDWDVSKQVVNPMMAQVPTPDTS